MGLLSWVAVSSILVTPVTDTYFQEKIQTLDLRRDQALKLTSVSSDQIENKRAKLFSVLEELEKLRNHEEFRGYEFFQQDQTKATSLNTAIYERTTALQQALKLDDDPKQNRYTLLSLVKVIEKDGLLNFALSFFLKIAGKPLCIFWLGDIASEQGDMRAAAWAYEKFLNIAPSSSLTLKAEKKLIYCFKQLGWKKRLIEKGIPAEELENLSIIPSPVITKAEPYRAYIKDSYQVGLDIVFKKDNAQEKPSTLRFIEKSSGYLYPEKYLVSGNKLFVPHTKSDVLAGYLVYDLNTKEKIAERDIAFLHPIFRHLNKIVTGWVEEGRFYFVAANIVYEIDDYGLEIRSQHELSHDEISFLLQLKPENISRQSLVDIIKFKQLYYLTAQLNEGSTKLDVDGLDLFLNQEYTSGIHSVFSAEWSRYPNFKLGEPLTLKLLESARGESSKKGLLSMQLLVQMHFEDSKEFAQYFSREFLDSKDSEIKIRSYLAMFYTCNGYVCNTKPLIPYAQDVHKVYAEIGLFHPSQFIRKATVTAIPGGHSSSVLFVRHHAEALLTAIAQEYALSNLKENSKEADLSVLVRMLSYTSHVPENLTEKLLAIYETIIGDCLQVKETSTIRYILHAMGEGKRTLTPQLEDMLFQIIKENPVSDKKYELHSAAIYSLGDTKGPDMEKRMELVLDALDVALSLDPDKDDDDIYYYYYGALSNLLQKINSITDEHKTRVIHFIEHILPEDELAFKKGRYTHQSSASHMLRSKLLSFEDKKHILLAHLNKHTIGSTLAEILSEDYSTELFTEEELEKIFDGYLYGAWWARDCLTTVLFLHKDEFFTFLQKVFDKEVVTKSDSHLRNIIQEDFLELAVEKMQSDKLEEIQAGAQVIFTKIKAFMSKEAESKALMAIGVGLVKLAHNGSEAQKTQAFIYFSELPNKFSQFKDIEALYSTSTAPEKAVLPELNKYLDTLTPSIFENPAQQPSPGDDY